MDGGVPATLDPRAQPGGLVSRSKRDMPHSTVFYREQPAPTLPAGEERRATARIPMPARVKLRGVGSARAVGAYAVADNIGAGGFYVRLMRRHDVGESVSALIRFGADAGEGSPAARLAVRGRVARVDELPGGVYGIAVRIMKYRFV